MNETGEDPSSAGEPSPTRRTWKWWTLRAAALIFFALLLLVAVCLINVWRQPSRQISVAKTENAEIDSGDVAVRLGMLIRTKTISATTAGDEFATEPFLEMHLLLQRLFPNVHTVMQRETVAGYSLLYTWPGADAELPPVVLMSHLDVVPVEKETLSKWKQPPWSGKVADGFIWGRGALDIKDGVGGILEACEHLLRDGFQPQRTIYIALGHDEESGGGGNKQIAALLKRRLGDKKLHFVLDEGGAVLHDIVPGVDKPVAFVGIAEKGYLSLKLRVDQPGGHSSMPPDQTAAGIMCAAVARLEADPFPLQITTATAATLDFLAPESSFTTRTALSNRWLTAPLIRSSFAAKPSGAAVLRTTTAVTMLRAGVKENVLPKTATAVVNLRLLPGDSWKDAMRRIIRVIDDPRVSVKPNRDLPGWDASPTSSTSSPAFQTLQQSIASTFPETIVAPGLITGATDSRHYEEIADDVYRFMPTQMHPTDLPRIHGVNERIRINHYTRIIQFMLNLIRRL